MSQEVMSWLETRRDLDPLDRYNQQLRRGLTFGFLKEDKVLDVGPGNFPFPFATHRIGIDQRDDAKDGTEFKLCDIEKGIDYPDKFFDYVYCSHVLEHLDDPISAAREISRVGQRGYIEVPSGFCTMFLNYGTVHPKWFCYPDDDGFILFSPWNEKFLGHFQNKSVMWAMDMIVNCNIKTIVLSTRERVLRDYYYNTPGLFDPNQLWVGEIKVRKCGVLFQ